MEQENALAPPANAPGSPHSPLAGDRFQEGILAKVVQAEHAPCKGSQAATPGWLLPPHTPRKVLPGEGEIEHPAIFLAALGFPQTATRPPSARRHFQARGSRAGEQGARHRTLGASTCGPLQPGTPAPQPHPDAQEQQPRRSGPRHPRRRCPLRPAPRSARAPPPARSNGCNRLGHFPAAPRLRVPGATSAKHAHQAERGGPGEVLSGSCSLHSV